MFTEYEIESLVENESLMAATVQLKKDFIKQEAPYLEIKDEDFFSLVLMAPTVGVALADEKVTFFEEMALNKKARKLSKGGYFLKKDPIVFAMKYLIKTYDQWEDRFLEIIRMAMESTFDIKSMEKQFDPNVEFTISQYRMEILACPYIFIRFLVSFFLDGDDDEIFGPRSMSKTDFSRVESIGAKLGLNKIPVFHYFCKTFVLK
ncbi:MAG: hypothetical protein JXR07_10000 [Reichenbachiella sp.]